MRVQAILIVIAIFASIGAGASVTAAEPIPKTIVFNRDVRPVLSDKCFECHGPDKNTRKAKFRLDLESAAKADLGGYFAIVPGKPEKSELYRRITTEKSEDLMPPADSRHKLSARDIQILRRWIEQGAAWQPHWAYIPPARPALPKVRNNARVATPVDAFILARLEKEKLRSAPEADRRTLSRRLSFDLTGLPPTIEEVRAFENDSGSKAYENLVDRLLASPHYGERMAMHWLDLVRYADTDGFHADNYRSVWPYRDYVIRVFNENRPFDRFTLEQLGGDLLPNATMEQRIASTYNRLNRTTEEGGSQAKEYLAKYAADRVRTTSAVWLGATLGCAECHDHKFDPFTTRDFYRLEAFFADIKEIGVGKPEGSIIPNAMQTAQLERFDSDIERLQKVLDTATPDLERAQAIWEKEVLSHAPPQFGVWHSIGPFAAKDFEAAFKTAFGPEKEIDLNRAYEEGKIKWTPHPEWENGKVHNLTGDHAATYLFRTINADIEQPLNLSLGSDDAIKVWLNGKEVLSKKVQRPAEPDQEKITVQLAPGENRLLMKIVNGTGGYAFYFRPGTTVPDNVLALLKTPLADRSTEQQTELARYYRSIAKELNETRTALAQAKKQKDELVKSIPTTLMTVKVEPRPMRILPRGNWMDDSGEVVTPAVPAFLNRSGEGAERLSRLDLGRWLASRENPLAARAFVNRLWKLYFGTGLSKVLDDLGSQGELPTHPELLDWLAVEFMDSGWNVKHIVKMIVLSNTYRQSAECDEKVRERDPYNRLLARQSRFRIEAEMVRDNALAVSGLLVRTVGGPSVKPYQPDGFWDQLNFPKRKYINDTGEAQYRRGLYSFWCRTFPHPSLTAFDAPGREECVAMRNNSNTPLQALVLLNDPTYVEAARVFAERTLRQCGNASDERIRWMFEQALDRLPKPAELKILNQLVVDETATFRADRAAAEAFVRVGNSSAPKELDPAELAAWSSVARTLLNLHETITRH
jgi:hypothetical protein